MSTKDYQAIPPGAEGEGHEANPPPAFNPEAVVPSDNSPPKQGAYGSITHPTQTATLATRGQGSSGSLPLEISQPETNKGQATALIPNIPPKPYHINDYRHPSKSDKRKRT
eukprot:36241_1